MTATAAPFDVQRIRADFPILHKVVHGKPLVYLDNAASGQVPRPVLDRLLTYQTTEHANVHRGVHTLSQEATEAYEGAREAVRRFINARSTKECIFTRGCTESINLVMQAWGRMNVKAGDEIVVSEMEHHANIVPWQMLCEEVGARLVVAPITDAGELDFEAYKALLGPKTRLVAITHVSNTLGTINPVREVVAAAHAVGAVVMVDGAQAVPHMAVDVQALDADFYAFSGHKMYAPTGIGVLYGKQALLEAMRPYQGGGSMILSVTFEKTTYNELPAKFEAGTPPILGAIGLGAAITWMEGLGMDHLAAHEHMLQTALLERLRTLPFVRLIGTPRQQAAVQSFVVEGIHPHDVGSILDTQGVAVRVGHHCSQPLMKRFGVPATVRASFAAFNTLADVDALVAGLRVVWEELG